MISPPDRPKNLEAERGLLSSLLKGDVFAIALDEGVSEQTFTSPLHVELWRTMESLDKAKEQIDEVSMMQRLGTEGMERLGKEDVWHVFNACELSLHVDRFAKAAREAERLRRVQLLGMELLDKTAVREDSTLVIEYADRALYALNAQAKGLLDGHAVDEAAWKDFTEARERGGKNGRPTGIHDLDSLLGGGLRDRSLTVLAARPSTGKTALALQMSAFMMSRWPVYFQSLEMNAGSLGKRLIGHMSNVPIHVIESKKEDNIQFKALEKAREDLREGKLKLDDKGGVSMALARAKARRVEDVGLVVIDYCGLVSPSDPKAPREQQIAGISKDCKMLAEELGCPVLLLSQLNRSAEQAQREPRLSDLRESGALEQDADNVILLHQPDQNDREKVTLLLAKNRFGQTGRVTLKFDRSTQTFKAPSTEVRQGYREPFMS